jgi:signal transduction histidine kinase
MIGVSDNIFKILDEANELKFSQPYKSLEKAQHAYLISIKSGDKKAESYSLFLMGACFEILSNYPEAMKCLSESIKLASLIGDKKKMADGLNTIGIINDNLGNYANALKTYFRAVKIYDELGENSSKAIVQSNIGLVYTNINDYVNALKFYTASNETAAKLKDDESLLVTNINIGLTYRLLKEFDKAESHLHKALEIAEQTNDKLRRSIAYAELGDLEIAQGNISSGFRYYKQSLELKYELNDLKGIAGILSVIGEYQLRDGLIDEAKTSFFNALEISEKLGLEKLSFEINKLLAQIFEKTGDFRQALKHSKTSHTRELKFFHTESDLKAKNLSIQHEVDRAQKEAEIQKLRNVELAKALEDVKKLNDNLQDLNQEKNEFMAVAVHDLKNPLQNILSTARVLKKSSSTDAEMINEFTSNIIFQTDRMFNLIKKLLDHNAIDQGNISIRNSVFRADSICRSVISNHLEKAAEKNITIRYNDDTNGASLNSDFDILAQILDNLISNALKFSPLGKSVFVRTSLETNNVIFEVNDEGPGFSDKDKEKMYTKFARLSAKPTGQEHSTGLGLSIVRKLTEIINASIHFENNPGGGAKFALKVRQNIIERARNEDS